MHEHILIAIAAAAMLTVGSFAAEALPAASSVPAAYSGVPHVLPVSGGCGIYRHRGPYGGCQPNVRRPFVRRFVRRCVIRRGPFGGRRRICRTY